MDDEKTNVSILPGSGKRDPNAMLEAAKIAELDEVVILGFRKDGSLFFSGSEISSKQIHWLMSCGMDEFWRLVNDDDG